MAAINPKEYLAYEQVAIPLPEQQEEPKKPEQSAKQKQQRRKKIRFVKNIIVMVCVFSLFAVVIYRSSVISGNNMEYIRVEKEISDKQRYIRDIKLKIAEKEDLAHIREVAQDELNMSAPDKDQVKYIVKEEPVEQVELSEDISVWDSIGKAISDFASAVQSWLQ